MDRVDLAVKKFCAVRDAIDQTRYPSAYRMAFAKPLRFFEEHGTEEAISILVTEYENKTIID